MEALIIGASIYVIIALPPLQLLYSYMFKDEDDYYNQLYDLQYHAKVDAQER